MTKHPAVYNDALLPVLAEMLQGRLAILDPFGGTGKVLELRRWLPGALITACEIEPEWARSGTITADSKHLPFADGTFDAICTSPCYGNRMADHFHSRDPRRREITYRSCLGHDLHAENAGRMQWGDDYRDLHLAVYGECVRVLADGGRFVLNCKDHIRAGARVAVTDWHIAVLEGLSFQVLERRAIPCPGMRFGQNHELRMDHEDVVKLRLLRRKR